MGVETETASVVFDLLRGILSSCQLIDMHSATAIKIINTQSLLQKVIPWSVERGGVKQFFCHVKLSIQLLIQELNLLYGQFFFCWSVWEGRGGVCSSVFGADD